MSHHSHREPTPEPSRVAGGSGDTRAKILEVAEALFSRSGYAGIGLREVARNTGLGKSSLFHHFESKQQLYLEVLEGVLARIEARVRPAVAQASGPVAQLDAGVGGFIDVLAEHPTTARLLLRGLFEDDQFPQRVTDESRAVEAKLMAMVEIFQAIVRDGVRSGVFRPDAAADATQSMIGATVYHFASGDFGEQVTGGEIFSAPAVARRKREVKHLLRAGLAVGTTADPT